VEAHYRKLAGYREDVLNRFPEAAAIFLHNGKVPPAGHVIKQPDLARVLTLLAEKGKAGFYQGEVVFAPRPPSPRGRARGQVRSDTGPPLPAGPRGRTGICQ
jgi:hypothetical protein